MLFLCTTFSASAAIYLFSAESQANLTNVKNIMKNNFPHLDIMDLMIKLALNGINGHFIMDSLRQGFDL